MYENRNRRYSNSLSKGVYCSACFHSRKKCDTLSPITGYLCERNTMRIISKAVEQDLYFSLPDVPAEPQEILFLDIEMPAMDGITLAKKLRERSDSIYIVFLTGHVEYALEGYEVNALRYLTKPIQEDKLREVLRFVMDKSSSKRQLLIKVEGEETLINVSDIIYLEAQNQYVMIYTI